MTSRPCIAGRMNVSDEAGADGSRRHCAVYSGCHKLYIVTDLVNEDTYIVVIKGFIVGELNCESAPALRRENA